MTFERDESELSESQLAEFKKLLQRENAVLVAHFYTSSAIQKLADATGGCVGDSLEMAKFATRSDATTLVVAGVRFMGETAKILNPGKRVLMPTVKADCSLDIGCPADKFARFCSEHRDRTVVVYINTSAAVKALADWVVTSSIALPVVKALHARGEKILWAPDRYLGGYIARQTGADMLLWDAACEVHERFVADGILRLKRDLYPDAAVLVHPESPAEVIAIADVVGSTAQLLSATQTRSEKIFIVATEGGILYQMKQHSPDKQFILAPVMPALNLAADDMCRNCARCRFMAMNTLAGIERCLVAGQDEIVVSEKIAARALVSLTRMMNFKE